MNFNITGSYTSDGNSRIIQIRSGILKFELFNYTNAASTANPGVIKRAWWQQGMPAASYVGVQNTDGAATDETVVSTTNGFTLVNTQTDAQLEAPVTIMSISTAATPVVTTTAPHGYNTGDIVRLTNTTGALQIGGNDYVITVTAPTTFTINQPQLSVAASAGFARRLRYQAPFYPRNRTLMSVSQAANAVCVTSAPHGVVVGQVITFRVPDEYGMRELNNLNGTVTAVGSTTQFTVDIDTTAFTAFAYPLAAAYPFTKAQAIPFGDELILDGAYTNTEYIGIQLGTDVVGALNDVVYYEATYDVFGS